MRTKEDEDFPLLQARNLLVKDIWLRYRRQQAPSAGYSIVAYGSDNSESPPEAIKDVEKLGSYLKPFIGGFQTHAKYDKNFVRHKCQTIGHRAMEQGLIYGKWVPALMKTAFNRNLRRSSGEPCDEPPSSFKHLGAFSIPVKFVFQSEPKEKKDIHATIKVPRLELLPGISAFYIDEHTPLYEQIKGMKAHHPLIPNSLSKESNYLPIVGVSEGPSELTPLFAGNDAESFRIAQQYGLPVIRSIDSHSSVNYGPFMEFIPDLTVTSEKKKLLEIKGVEQKVHIYKGKKRLPIAFANEAVYRYLFRQHGENLVPLEDASLSTKGEIPGSMEPIMAYRHFVNVSKVISQSFPPPLQFFKAEKAPI